MALSLRGDVMQVAYGTDVGQIRQVNEDSLWCDHHIWVVADGMGGAAAGEVASGLAVNALKNWTFPPSGTPIEIIMSDAQRAVEDANYRVYERAQKDPKLRGMGTTLTMGLFRSGSAVIAHVGDSRAYLLRNDTLTQLTDDHSVVGEMIRAGNLSVTQAERHPYRNMLTRALGVAPQVEVDIAIVELHPGDAIFLCTDGLTAVVSDDEIARLIAQHLHPQRAVDALISCANERGGPDNISVILACYSGGPEDE